MKWPIHHVFEAFSMHFDELGLASFNFPSIVSYFQPARRVQMPMSLNFPGICWRLVLVVHWFLWNKLAFFCSGLLPSPSKHISPSPRRLSIYSTAIPSFSTFSVITGSHSYIFATYAFSPPPPATACTGSPYIHWLSGYMQFLGNDMTDLLINVMATVYFFCFLHHCSFSTHPFQNYSKK